MMQSLDVMPVEEVRRGRAKESAIWRGAPPRPWRRIRAWVAVPREAPMWNVSVVV